MRSYVKAILLTVLLVVLTVPWKMMGRTSVDVQEETRDKTAVIGQFLRAHGAAKLTPLVPNHIVPFWSG